MIGRIDQEYSLCAVHAAAGDRIGQNRSRALHMSVEQPPHGKGQVASNVRADWLRTRSSYPISSDWDQQNVPYVPKAPGWVIAATLFVLPILLWAMLVLVPFVLLSILSASGLVFYWSSRKRVRSAYKLSHDQRKCFGKLSEVKTHDARLVQLSSDRIDANNDLSLSWLLPIIFLSLLFCLSVGMLVVQYGLIGEGQ